MESPKNSQLANENLLLSTGTEPSSATSVSAASPDSFAALYRRFNNNLPINFSLQHGTRHAAEALRTGILVTLVDTAWRDREKLSFAERISEIITSDTFIAQASSGIGLPNKGESEDDYVERGKTVLRRLLRSVLD